ncbi:MAG TPA: hypothetical protein VGF95_12890 [Solirubrobacteraceae bacterium]|jgi:hypothetical protein
MLAGGYVATYEAGFRKDGKRVVSQRYIVSSGAAADERAGGIYARADVTGASWFTFMTYSSKWEALTAAAQQAVKDKVPIKRTREAPPPTGMAIGRPAEATRAAAHQPCEVDFA